MKTLAMLLSLCSFAAAQDTTAILEGLVADPSGSYVTGSRSVFRRLDPTTQAAQFGGEGRNGIRGPGIGNVDISLLKSLVLTETQSLPFQAECFNLMDCAQLRSGSRSELTPRTSIWRETNLLNEFTYE